MKSWRRLLCALSVLALPAAHAYAQTKLPDHMYTSGGVDLGKPDWRDITESESSVRFTDSQDVKLRKAAKLLDRYVEQVTLRNNASFNYTRIYSRRDDFGTNGVEQAAAWLKNTVASKFYTDRGIQFDDRQVKRAGELAYLVQTSAAATCFAFKAVLGDSLRKDQDISGGVCYSPSSRTAAVLEQEMLSLLSRARFASSLDQSSFAVSFQIPDSVVAAASAPNMTQPKSASTTDTPTQTATSDRPLPGRDALPFLEGRWTTTECNASYTEFKFSRPDRLEATYNYVYQPDSRKNLSNLLVQIHFDETGSIVAYYPDLAYTTVMTFHGPDLRETDSTDKKGLNSHGVYHRCK
jgi:hypothetical protein